MKRIKDNDEYVQCENSNLRFHGTKLDRQGNECAVFSTPNHNTFSIQRNSLWGTQSWNTGSKSTMDAETFLAKNPKVTLESLERDVIKLANQTNAAWGKNIRVHNKQILDSQKIKDASDTPLNGLLSIAFNDGTEDEMCKTVQQHANESGEINGIQYETYETDEQDGVAFVDLCAIGVSDATEFVKALLEKWGVLENTADIDFDTQTEEEYNEEVADSRKQVRDNKDYLFNNYKIFNPPVSVALNDNFTWEVEQIHLNDVKNDYITGSIIVTENIYQISQKKLVSRHRTRYEFKLDLTNNTITFGFYIPDKVKHKAEQLVIDLVLENFGDYIISDSRVNDMTKPVHLRGYAEKMRAKRRKKNDEQDEPETENENQKQDVTDSRRVNDNANNIILHFHKGRGGRFHNQGFLTYEGEESLSDFVAHNGQDVFVDNDGYYMDGAGNSLGNAKEGDETGVLDFDGEYDTDYFIYLNEVEFDDSYYGAIVRADYVEPEVAEYVSKLIINDIVDNYSLNDLPTANDNDYEDQMDYHAEGFYHDYGVDNIDIKNLILNFLDETANK